MALAKLGKRFMKSKNNKYAKHQSGDDNKEIERHMKADNARDSKLMRILLLGPGDSGKTTILKQMKKINNQMHEQEFRSTTPYIRISVVSYIRILCQQSVLLRNQYGVDTLVDPENEEARQQVVALTPPFVLTVELAKVITKLWGDPGIKATLLNRPKYQIHDNVEYFLNSVERIASAKYMPSFEDFVRIRMRSTGFSQTRVNVEMPHFGRHTFEITDVGGQRSERHKWMKFISTDINAVCFVIAVSEYDMMLMEDNETNRLQEAINLFSEIMMKGNFFDKKSVLVFFNKYDLFVEKIKRVPITVAFPDYPDDKKDPHDEDEVIRFVISKFLDVLETNKITLEVPLHFSRTSALQTDLIERVFRDLLVDLVQRNMRHYGVM